MRSRVADERSYNNPLDAVTPATGGGPGVPNLGAIEKAGVYQGGKDPAMPDAQPYLWRCPTCRQQYATPFAAGCPQCQQVAEQEKLQRKAEAADEATLLQAVLRNPAATHARQSLRAMGLTIRARRTLYRALAAYAEQRANQDDLPRGQIIGWARLLSQAEVEETGDKS